jgi:RNA polymerase sigma-70 factor (ECF subfamily)
VTEPALIEAASAGDDAAFRDLAERYRRELHVHCYRMLGSVHDAEDALQETWLRAWRHLDSFEGRSSFRAWLYRIATNVCLAALGKPPEPPTEEPAVLTPYPDAWLDEVAALLDVSPSSVHSAVRRARATVARAAPERTPPPDDVQRTVVQRYIDAWESVDIPGLVALMREDAVMTMPPDPAVFLGRQEIGGFFATVPANGALDQIPLVPTRANRQPAVGAYFPDQKAGVYRPYGVMVLTLDGDSIAEITGCTDPSIFTLLGLPTELEM